MTASHGLDRPLLWVCHDCDEQIGPEYKPNAGRCAGMHVDVVMHAERRDHWLYLHPGGSRLREPVMSVHASDWGGVYLDTVTENDARHIVSSYRARAGSGTF